MEALKARFEDQTGNFCRFVGSFSRFDVVQPQPVDIIGNPRFEISAEGSGKVRGRIAERGGDIAERNRFAKMGVKIEKQIADENVFIVFCCGDEAESGFEQGEKQIYGGLLNGLCKRGIGQQTIGKLQKLAR